ncbi:hypothetical protein GYMLUDRAFT_227470 [Collybiopsis luxurians FD-317 M1]|uniref:Cerato-platanin n=1 Tax=Collybiopsis luxurians FD-317 M1 TaxID=944289 RepID=A0A0D0CTK1_9AGAR|nr:hypothetical protein GYMLUDRAFT_227470 [Collybiopsis luxurians FD-317 M1]
MKFLSLVLPATLVALVSADQLRYDAVYDKAGQSLTTVSCSDGANGMITKGFTTFGSLPNFANIGGAVAVTGWNSTNCGTCWNLSYTNPQGKTSSVNMLAIDNVKTGFVISLSAMNTLTGGHAVELGVVNVVAKQVASSNCKL